MFHIIKFNILVEIICIPPNGMQTQLKLPYTIMSLSIPIPACEENDESERLTSMMMMARAKKERLDFILIEEKQKMSSQHHFLIQAFGETNVEE